MQKSVLLKNAVVVSALASLYVFVFGLSPVGVFTIPLLCGYRGLAFSYLSAAIFKCYGFKGFVFFAVSLILPAVFWIPGLMLCSLRGMITSRSFLNVIRKRGNFIANDLKMHFLSSVLLFFMLVLSRLTEVYIASPLLNIVCGLYL